MHAACGPVFSWHVLLKPRRLKLSGRMWSICRSIKLPGSMKLPSGVSSFPRSRPKGCMLTDSLGNAKLALQRITACHVSIVINPNVRLMQAQARVVTYLLTLS
jgi:hypothetical protein